VATFSNMQNFYLSYMNVLGNPSFYIAPDSAMDGLSFAMRGAVDVLLEMSLSWETMTFGYAYRVNPNIIFAFNLHRHLFVLDVAAQVNVDILGAFRFEPVVAGGGADVGGISVEGEINYNAERTRGVARAHYKAETWSPTFGIDLWRFGWTSRFGVDTRVKGEFEAVYSLPFFIDPETFSIGISDAYALLDGENRSKLLNNAVDSVRYYIEPQENYLRWRMPHGHTMSFDLVPDKLRISYTKFFGEIGMNLSGIRKEVTTLTEQDTTEVGFDIGFTVDNIIMLNGHWRNAFFNLGVFGIDFRAGSRDHLLGGALDKAGWVMLGDQAMVPILNLGSAIGSKLQLLLELDILPLPAVKTGIFYYF